VRNLERTRSVANLTLVNQETLGQVAVAAYASLLKARIPARTNASIVLTNTGESGAHIDWKVLVSNDPEGAVNTWCEDKAEATLNQGSTIRHVLTGSFFWVDVQIKSNVSGKSGLGNCWLMAVGN